MLKAVSAHASARASASASDATLPMTAQPGENICRLRPIPALHSPTWTVLRKASLHFCWEIHASQKTAGLSYKSFEMYISAILYGRVECDTLTNMGSVEKRGFSVEIL